MDVSGAMTAMDKMSQSKLKLDLLPNLTEGELQQTLSSRSGAEGKQTVVSVLNRWLPSRLATALATGCGARSAEGDKPIAELSSASLRTLLDDLKRWHLPVQDTRGFAKAEVTAGGVSLKEVNPKTMQSRVCDDLYIAGEVLDVDGWIGGYNFQAAFSTGRASAIAATQDQHP